jgi:2-amino-4-hydroxy-6-hydroxymethyldihydropteridine diphosphokinase
MMLVSIDLDEAVIIALGANLSGAWGSPTAAIRAALERLNEFEINILRVSSLWRSASWPDPKQPDYINAIALVETPLVPHATLTALHALEDHFGRARLALNAPRVLDLDLIAHGRRVVAEEGLILPHPRAADRLFVMGPLAEVAPDWTHPVTGMRAADLAVQARVGRDARPVEAIKP